MRNLAGASKNASFSLFFSYCAGWAKGSYFVGQQMLQLLGPEFILNHNKCLQEKMMVFWLISGWFVQCLASLWVVWLVCGWFVGGLAGLWVVLSFTANGFSCIL